MGGQDKLFASLGGRPLLERSLAAVAGAREVGRIVLVVAPGREADAAALGNRRVVAIVPGGAHRGASVEWDSGLSRRSGRRTRTATGATRRGHRPGRPRPRWGPPTGDPRARLCGRGRRGGARRRDPGPSGHGHAETHRERPGRRDRGPLAPVPRRRPPRARAPRSCDGRWRRFQRTARGGSRTRPPCWRPVQSPSTPSPETP